MTLTLPSDREIVMTRVFNAPRDLVFKAWTRPEHVKHWYGCNDATLRSCEIDLRPGGAYKFVLHAHGASHTMRGVYREVVRPNRLVYTEGYVTEGFASNEALVTVTFVEQEGKTTLTINILHQSPADRDGHIKSGMERGAAESLDRLDAHVGTMESPVHVNAYLMFNGQCEAAFRLYEKVLGGKIEAMIPHEGTPAAENVPADWRKKILHARMSIGGKVFLMASDCPPDRYEPMKGFSVTIGVDEPEEADRIFHALAENGIVRLPIQKTFWATRFGMLVDQFGTPWMVNCEQAN
jgi:PhnB protein